MGELSRSELVNLWVQTIAIIIGGIWGLVYSFGYLEIYKPAQISGSISADIELRNAGMKENLKAVFFLVWGYSLNEEESDPEFLGYLNGILNKDENYVPSKSQDFFISKDLPPLTVEIIGGGNIFDNIVFVEGGELSKEVIIHFDDNLYDYIEIKVVLPVSIKADQIYTQTIVDSIGIGYDTYVYSSIDSSRILDLTSKSLQKPQHGEVEFQAFHSDWPD